MIISNGYGEIILWPGSRVNDIYDACAEGILAEFDNDGVADLMRKKIPEIEKQNCSTKFLEIAFIEPMRESRKQWNGTNI